MVITIAAGVASGTTTANSVAVTEGDVLTMKIVQSGTETLVNAFIVVFVANE
jgi:hypothetical protein